MCLASLVRLLWEYSSAGSWRPVCASRVGPPPVGITSRAGWQPPEWMGCPERARRSYGREFPLCWLSRDPACASGTLATSLNNLSGVTMVILFTSVARRRFGVPRGSGNGRLPLCISGCCAAMIRVPVHERTKHI